MKNKYTKYQRKILKWIKKNPNKTIITAEQGAGTGKTRILN